MNWQSRLRHAAGHIAQPQNAIFLAVLFALPAICIDALSDPDVWWHITQGNWILQTHQFPRTEIFSYAAQGTPIVAHEWLAEVVFALIFNAGGLFWLAIAMGFFCWSGFAAIAITLRRNGAGALLSAVTLLLAAKAAQPVLGTRPQIATFVFTAWVLLLVTEFLRRGGKRVWLTPLIILVWANVHAGFITGIGLIALLLLIDWAERRELNRQLGLVFIISAIAACLNPQGPSLYTYAIGAGSNISTLAIQEWQSPNFHDSSSLPMLLFILSMALVMAGNRAATRWALLGVAGAGWSLFAVRNFAVGAALMAPAWGIAGQSLWNSISRKNFPRRAATLPAVTFGTVIVIAGGFATGVVIGRTSGDSSPAGIARSYPDCAAQVLADAPQPQRVYVTFFDAGYVIYRGYPRVSVYEYGALPDPAGNLLNDYMRIASGTTDPPSAAQLLDESRTSAVLTSDSGLISLLRTQPNWDEVTTDNSLHLFARAGSGIELQCLPPGAAPLR